MKSGKVLFLTNRKYISPESAEGGVKLCTGEYIDLIATSFEVILFPVDIHLSLSYKIKKKLGVSVYGDYAPASYIKQLEKVVSNNNIECIFLNLTNTITFSRHIKKSFPHIKIILCSHGNESGDFLHEIVNHQKYKGFKKIIAQYSLGKMLSTESEFRNYIDLVLTVSEVEEQIEKWIGANNVKMIPRTIPDNKIEHKPIGGRIGFFGDLTHAPNYFGIKNVCDSLAKQNPDGIELRLVGACKKRGMLLAGGYSFVTYLGYLPEGSLESEASSWTFALNPVFYYSRGVSTKLGKALSWGLPVITSMKGMRGYYWKKGEILSCETPKEMAEFIMRYSKNIGSSVFYRDQIEYIKATSPELEAMMKEVCKLIIQDI